MKKKKLLVIIIAIIALLAISATIIFTSPINEKNKDNNDAPTNGLPTATVVVPTESTPSSSDENNKTPSGTSTNTAGLKWYEGKSEDQLIPVSQPDFLNKPLESSVITGTDPWNSPDLKDQNDTFLDAMYYTDLSIVSRATLPSELNTPDLTSNVNDAFTKDGGLNPNYFYWTNEVFMSTSTAIIYALIDPIYGNWVQYQHASSDAKHTFNPVNTFGAFMSENLKKQYANTKDYSSFGVYADWNSNDYGLKGKLLPDGHAVWFGEITAANGEMVPMEDNQAGWRVNASYNIKFTAYTVDGKTLTKTGVLDVSFISTPVIEITPDGTHVQLDKIKLTMDK